MQPLASFISDVSGVNMSVTLNIKQKYICYFYLQLILLLLSSLITLLYQEMCHVT